MPKCAKMVQNVIINATKMYYFDRRFQWSPQVKSVVFQYYNCCNFFCFFFIPRCIVFFFYIRYTVCQVLLAPKKNYSVFLGFFLRFYLWHLLKRPSITVHYSNIFTIGILLTISEINPHYSAKTAHFARYKIITKHYITCNI